VVEVTEQAIMEHMLLANRNGHIACTQGGESLAGLVKALAEKKVSPKERAVLNATAHAIKFSDFQEMYFQDSFPPEFGIRPKKGLQNHPVSAGLIKGAGFSSTKKLITQKKYNVLIEKTALKITKLLGM
jgi:threonine synthase